MKQISTELLTERLKNKTTYEDFFEENNDLISSDSFTVLLRKHIGLSSFELPQLIERTQIAKTYAYQIINGKKNPSRNKILQFALALELNLEDSNKLLRAGGSENLYVKDRRDSILMFSLMNTEKNPVQSANEMLHDHDLNIL